jgi:hypothetical protein
VSRLSTLTYCYPASKDSIGELGGLRVYLCTHWLSGRLLSHPKRNGPSAGGYTEAVFGDRAGLGIGTETELAGPQIVPPGTKQPKTA